MTALVTITLLVLVGVAIVSIVAQSLDMKYVIQIVLGTSICLALGLTMVATVGVLLPSWLHIFFIYIPCGLLIYSIIAIGGD